MAPLPLKKHHGSRTTRRLGDYHGRSDRGTIYVGVTADLPARIVQHRQGTGSDFCARYGLHRLVWAERGATIEACIAHEKRLKRWKREWKFALIEQANPDWSDRFEWLV